MGNFTSSAHYLKVALCSLLLLIMSGCSTLEKHGYFRPAGGDNWIQKSYRYKFPTYSYACGNKTIEVNPALFYKYTYTVGPIVFPVIPTFNLGGGTAVRDDITISVRVNPSNMAGGIDNTQISMVMPDSRQRILPDMVLINEIAQNPVKEINVTYKADFAKADNFTLSFDNAIEGCTLTPLKFEKFYTNELVPFPKITIY